MPGRFLLMLAFVIMVSSLTVFGQTGDQQLPGGDEQGKQYLYQWTDDKGVVHISDGLGKVPEQYRAKAVKLLQRNQADPGPGQQVQRGPGPPSGTGSEAAERASKAAWQQRLQRARQRLADGERRYQALEQRRNERLQVLGGTITAVVRYAAVAEAERIEKEMKEVQRAIDEARTEIEVIIPEDARKAGIPPGWLRE